MQTLKILYSFVIAILLWKETMAQSAPTERSKVWVADNGNGTYKNPILHADYSDPDAIRVGDDYYMISSSFNQSPGLPILHSKDLVNWTLIGHALDKQPPYDHFSRVQHGNGVWAPSIRHHNNQFYIYYPDPDFGIYLTKATKITGPWTKPVLVFGGKGLIDPCPLWDEDGKNYLVYALAGSRAGYKSVIVMKQLNAAADSVMGEAVMLYDGHELDATIEGPKIYKRNKYYYVFAPAGGVSTGWQTILRSKNIYGPYERKVVLEQGETNVNGPHQGAWVQTPGGEDWFLHFQDKEAYGRIVHLQPMKWVNNWPVIGEDKDGDGKGIPVMVYKKPATGKTSPIVTPADSDEFNNAMPGRQWQWHGNPLLNQSYGYPSKGVLRLNSMITPDTAINLWDVPSLLTQKFPAETFTATTKFAFTPKTVGEKFGLVVMGMDYAYIAVTNETTGWKISYASCLQADKGKKEKEITIVMTPPDTNLYFRVEVREGAVCTFSYSTDGNRFININEELVAKPGRWIGATVGLFNSRKVMINDAGFTDVDWFRVTPVTAGE